VTIGLILHLLVPFLLCPTHHLHQKTVPTHFNFLSLLRISSSS
jgi:hypothetical protein